MHIADGILSGPVLVTGALLAAGGTAVGLRRLSPEAMPRAALLAAGFFLATQIHLNLGGVSLHLLFTGLLGLLLGWGAFPVVLVGLLLQYLFFQHGGLTTLGVNVVVQALPALLVGTALWPLLRRGGAALAWPVGLAAGALSTAGSVGLLALALQSSQQPAFARVLLAANLPLVLLEAIAAGAALHLLCRVQPALLDLPVAPLEVANGIHS